MRFLSILFCSLALCALTMERQAFGAPTIAVAETKLAEPMELRILAQAKRHEKIIAAAKAQQARETAADQPWSNIVFESADSKTPVARWVAVSPVRKNQLIGNKEQTEREPPAQAGEPKTWQILVVLGKNDITSSDVASAKPGLDERSEPAVYFELTEAGAERFKKLTGTHLPEGEVRYSLGIILDNKIYNAPRINSIITSSGMISGSFTEQETKALADVLNSKQGVSEKKSNE